MRSFEITSEYLAKRLAPVGRCIYCAGSPLGEEHIVPEGLGGSLILPKASCAVCSKITGEIERSILQTVLYVPRVRLGVKRKRRKNRDDRLRVMARVGGRDVVLNLPVEEAPALMFLIELVPAGILVNRPASEPGMRGLWMRTFDGWKDPRGNYESVASPVLDTLRFVQFLAKIGHGFAVACLGLEGFTPLLPDLILGKTDARFHLVGGEGTGQQPPETAALHELSLEEEMVGDVRYAVVRIRLFSKLGAPVYRVVAGSVL